MRSLTTKLEVLGDWGNAPTSKISKTCTSLPCLRVCDDFYGNDGTIIPLKKRIKAGMMSIMGGSFATMSLVEL